MISHVTNREFLLDLAKSTLKSLESGPPALEGISDVNPHGAKNSLEATLDWAIRSLPMSPSWGGRAALAG